MDFSFEIRVIGYFRSLDGRENNQWVLRIVQFVLDKQRTHKRHCALFCLFYILLMIQYSLFSGKCVVHEFYCLPLRIILCVVYWLINDKFYFSTLHKIEIIFLNCNYIIRYEIFMLYCFVAFSFILVNFNLFVIK